MLKNDLSIRFTDVWITNLVLDWLAVIFSISHDTRQLNKIKIVKKMVNEAIKIPFHV